MAMGKTHDWVTLGLVAPVFLVCRWGLGLDWPSSGLVAVGFWFGGMVLSPDLDTRSRPFYRWGVFRFIWWPYQWAIRHRSGWSHGIWLAPWLRLLYLSAVLILFYIGAVQGLSHLAGLPGSLDTVRHNVLQFAGRHARDFWLLGCGVWLGSLAHILLDGASSRFRVKRSGR